MDERVGPYEWVRYLLSEGGLHTLIGSRSCACFVVARSVDSQNFFERLSENLATIDSTTRQHVIFLLFYGETEVGRYPGDTDQGWPWGASEPGLTRVRVVPPPQLDLGYDVLFRERTSAINQSRFKHIMARVSDALMDFCSIRESETPCAIFVDPVTGNRLSVRLDRDRTWDDLRREVLDPLSDGFRDAGRWLQAAAHYELLKQQSHLEGEERRLYTEAVRQEADLTLDPTSEPPNFRSQPSLTPLQQLNEIEQQIVALKEQVRSYGTSPGRSMRATRLEKLRSRAIQRVRDTNGDSRRRQTNTLWAHHKELSAALLQLRSLTGVAAGQT